MSDFTTLVNYLTTIPKNPDFHSDTLIIAGNSLPHLIVSAAQFCEAEPAIQRVLFVGGIGHGTIPLIANCKKFYPKLVRTEWEQLSEAEITQEIFLHYCSRELSLLLEKKSTNTGENARFSYELFSQNAPTNFWLVQDPLVQKRAHVTFSKEWHLPLSAIQPLFFEQPKLIAFDTRPHFKNSEMDTWWEPEYFLSLVIGEIRRLNDDEKGYGPMGTGFIPHVDVPQDVLASYLRCRKYLENVERK
ncbi:YdcF family protein [Candidatus Enterococcus murrayae]|uniref:YdcF family protein n=1 Tax=Candidatus Enterococcus murrayae TaxID=2815321 RepID=A0ABS3HHR1_9ENTE|nr:ElyC/SanA/YdcF family protein [Enterococcus sp. MJM16]MBO0452996.1 YdcF family protein [Enterococcus sp. MJM16]